MKSNLQYSKLSSPIMVTWVKDRDHVLILEQSQEKIYRLIGVDAVVWGWLVSAYSYTKIVRLLSNLMVVSTSIAELHLQSIIRGWLRVGLLELEAGKHDEPDCE